MQQRYRHEHQGKLINIKDMTVTKALIAQPTGPQMLRAHVEANWEFNSATCKFSTTDVSITRLNLLFAIRQKLFVTEC